MAVTYDIAILGATPAGFAAAYFFARKGYSAAVIAAPRREAESPLADWVPGDFFRTPGLARALARKCRAGPFKRVCYHDTGLSQQVEHRSRTVAGYFLQSSRLNGVLKAAAVAAGAKVRTSRTSPAVRLQEDSVQIHGSTRVQARLLMVTHGSPPQIVDDLSLPVHVPIQPPLVVAALEVPVAAKRFAEKLRGAMHIVESRERSDIGMFFAAGRALHVRIISFSRAAGNRAAELSAMVGNLQNAGILPRNLRLGRARGAVWRPPAGAAAETETHVAKRCLVSGTAGGFVGPVSGQTIAPSVRSALLAAKTAIAALQSDNPQAALGQYKTAWRKELGAYLRPPSSSLQMLLPLLFVNKQLVSRFTGALLFGKGI
ncbi:MAG: NAD(P)/FAD-dependent oxidoreductase [Planctomycetota bacterium]|jgi:flavin-dependent dehydrogenase